MKKNPLISVVIPAFNEEKFLPRVLQSLLNQSFKNFEIIVVDNGSTDNTAKIAKEFGARVIFEKERGVGAARDSGFKAAKGEIVATTDADSILPPFWLSRISEEFQKEKDLVAFGGLCNLYSGPITARLACRFLLYPFWRLDKFFSGGWSLMGCNLAVKKEAYLKAGGFNRKLKIEEDVDFSHRIRKLGKVAFDPNFKVEVSGRRYKDGLIFGVLNYAPVVFSRWFLKKRPSLDFSVIRTERSSLLYRIFSLFLAAMFLLFLFSASISQAKRAEFIKEEIAVAKKIIKTYERKSIFLTFDDGPEEPFTSQILEILMKFKAKASFFVLGKKAKNNLEILKRMKREGHLIGNHAFSHSRILSFFGFLEKEIEETNKIIRKAIKETPKFFRPPFGLLTVRLRKKIENKGYKVVLWDVDSEDWKKIPPKKIAENIFKKAKENSIILFHDSKETAIALPSIIKFLKERNFVFRTIDQKC